MGKEYPFRPTGLCRVVTSQGTYLLEPRGPRSGRFAWVSTPEESQPIPEDVAWETYEWIHWVPDERHSGLRLRVKVLNGDDLEASILTGPVRQIAGDFELS